MKKIVVTGLGAVTPFGVGVNTFWQHAKAGESSATGKIADFALENFLAKRLSKKLDPFSQYALIAAQEALDDSGIDFAACDKNRIGVYVSNMFGGWEFTDRELRQLYTQGAATMNPYLSTAWFPAAPQGEITILHQLKGHSKTVDAGMAGGLLAIAYAVEAIRRGRVDKVLAGGAEAMLNPFMLAACNMAQDVMSRSGCYQPFATERDGWMPGEGAAFVMLEDYESACARNAPIYGVIEGFSHMTGRDFSRSMSRALADSCCRFSNIDLVMADAKGSLQQDSDEAHAIKQVFAQHDVAVTAPKSLCGHLCGAGGSLDAVMGFLSLKHQTALPTKIQSSVDETLPINLVSITSRPMLLNKIMINASSEGDVMTSLIISRHF